LINLLDDAYQGSIDRTEGGRKKKRETREKENKRKNFSGILEGRADAERGEREVKERE
jgi:hypothetical protein